MLIQYLGFETTPCGRDYLYRVTDAKSEKREFTFTISDQAFAEKRVPYQDAADLCYQKLQKDWLGNSRTASSRPLHAFQRGTGRIPREAPSHQETKLIDPPIVATPTASPELKPIQEGS